MNTFSLKVIASDKVFFDGKCGIIIVPALDGEQAIMSHHEDMVIATKEGEVRFKEKVMARAMLRLKEAGKYEVK